MGIYTYGCIWLVTHLFTRQKMTVDSKIKTSSSNWVSNSCESVSCFQFEQDCRFQWGYAWSILLVPRCSSHWTCGIYLCGVLTFISNLCSWYHLPPSRRRECVLSFATAEVSSLRWNSLWCFHEWRSFSGTGSGFQQCSVSSVSWVNLHRFSMYWPIFASPFTSLSHIQSWPSSASQPYAIYLFVQI